MVDVLILRTICIGDEAGYHDDVDGRKREVVEEVE